MVASLVALDFPLGPALEAALRRCVDESHAFCVLDQRLTASAREREVRALGATHILDSLGRRRLESGEEVDDEVALVMLTSGSSGPPKAAEHTWESLRASARLTQWTLRGSSAPVWFACLPANHIGGLAVVLRAVLDDARLVWGEDLDVSSAPRAGATHVSLVRPQLVTHDVSGYEVVLLGGARPPGDLASNVITTWGMTETGSGVVYDARPLPGVELATRDGEILVRTPTLFRGYRHSPRPRALGPDGRDDWFPTGDGGEFSDGVLRVRGRIDFVINTGGEKLWPEDLEAVLSRVPGVHDVAVTSRTDDRWGEAVVALVVGDSDLGRPLAEAAESQIGPWAKPKDVIYLAQIPRTSNGKLRRREIAEIAARGAT